MRAPERKIVSLADLQSVRAELAAQGQRVVQCHGCFDIVHPGHIRYLQAARTHGDVLIVSVSADEVVGKGFDRPYIHERLRLENLAALEIVDYVVLDHNTWAGPVLEALQPDVYIKGKEYETNRDPRFLRERELVEAWGGQVVFSSGDVVYSSTRIISMYRQRMDLDHEKVRIFCERNGLTADGLESTIMAVRGKRVVVVGDPILDVYVHCDAPTVAAEAAVLTVTPISEDWFVGGAGLVAAQLAVLGADVRFLTVHDSSANSQRFVSELTKLGVTVEAVPARRPTYLKRRFLVDGQKVFKVDEGLKSALPASIADEVQDRVASLLDDADGLVCIDFGYGLFGDALCEHLSNLCAQTGTPMFVDVSGRRPATLLKLRSARLATPTEDELRFCLGDSDSGLSVLASRYFAATGAKGLVLTLGSRGALYFHGPDQPGAARLRTEYLPSLGGGHAIDAVGAGDVYLSGSIAAELGGGAQVQGMYLGASLAALHVGALGNDPVTLLDLQQFLRHRLELGTA